MIRTLLVVALLAPSAACSLYLGEHSGSSASIPDATEGSRRCTSADQGACVAGQACYEPPADGAVVPRPTTCACNGGVWLCNSCPSVDSPPAEGSTCTPGDACNWESWEHGCSCGCSASGTWSCAPETTGTWECGGRPDAGVPDAPYPDAATGSPDAGVPDAGGFGGV